jgi:rieske iron-sulfur protein
MAQKEKDIVVARPPETAGACTAYSCSISRRTFVQAAGSVLIGSSSLLRLSDLHADEGTDAHDQRPTIGDRLVNAATEGAPTPLKVGDIPENSNPIVALPYDIASNTVRDGSRLNKLLLLRLPAESLDAETRARAADGVFAYSATCTHQGCEVSQWLPADQALMCFCHFSKFDVRAAGSVTAGPAPSNLPYLSLRSEGGELVIASAFNTKPGAKRSG